VDTKKGLFLFSACNARRGIATAPMANLVDQMPPVRSDVWFDDGNIARNTQFRVLQVDPLRFLHHLKQNISDYKGVDVGSRAIGFYD
jgi:hypothetical protein